MSTDYSSTANELSDRIFKLIPENPQILEMEDCWDLFNIKGFNCKDLRPSMFQASYALSNAKRKYKDAMNTEKGCA